MRHFSWVLIFTLSLLPFGFVAQKKEETPPPQRYEKPPFTLPEGFVAEKVAGAPLTHHPVMASFDEEGRLYLAENAGVNLRAPDLLQQLPSGIRRLVDEDGDGTFDSSSVFADRMTFPMGSQWLDGSLYVCAPPSVWKLDDPQRTGIARARRELVTRFGFTGNAASIHGPFLGPDGWLYWTDGRHGYEIERTDGGTLKGKAASIFRCKPDGSQVEVVCGGGMDDPVEIAFTPEGEPIATVDIFFGSPSRVDALIHCIEGGTFPYHPSVLGELKRTGPLLPAMTDLGWVAPSGLMRYRGEAFGPEYRDNLFSTQFNTHKIVRHIVVREGATLLTRDEDFLVSTHPDFHPTDVLEDADGSLLVIDTGGWFRIGCPTSQIAKPEVHGAIWRIRKKEGPRIDDPRGLKLDWSKPGVGELVKRLDDPRFVVRDRAVVELRKRAKEAITPLGTVLQSSKNERTRRTAVWVLSAIEAAESRGVIRSALNDPSASVRMVAARSLGLNRDVDSLTALGKAVLDDEPVVRREAATALGRLGRKEAVPALLQSMGKQTDRFLEHAIIYALIELKDRESTLAGLRDDRPAVRKAALIALDQMDGGGLEKDQVAPLLDSDDAALQQAALDVVAKHPEWAGSIRVWLENTLARKNVPTNQREFLVSALAGLSREKGVQELVARRLGDGSTSGDVRLLLLDVTVRTPVDPLPDSWQKGLNESLALRDEKQLWQAVTAIRGRGLTSCDQGLRRLINDTGLSVDLRILALGALGARHEPSRAEFDLLLGRLQPDLPPLSRLAAADALRALKLSGQSLLKLCEKLPSLGALELPRILHAFAGSRDRDVGLALVASLDRSPALTSIPPRELEQVLRDYPAEVHRGAGVLYRKLAVDLESQKSRLKELEPALSGGDVRLGRAVFFGQKAVCAACHTVGKDGGKVGPELTKIAAIRSEKDLLEAVVFPSSSIVRDYEAYLVSTTDGRELTGLIVRETPEAIFLVDAERRETRLSRSLVESIHRSPASLMPQGMDKQLTMDEMRDLIAFLRSLK